MVEVAVFCAFSDKLRSVGDQVESIFSTLLGSVLKEEPVPRTDRVRNLERVNREHLIGFLPALRKGLEERMSEKFRESVGIRRIGGSLDLGPVPTIVVDDPSAKSERNTPEAKVSGRPGSGSDTPASVATGSVTQVEAVLSGPERWYS